MSVGEIGGIGGAVIAAVVVAGVLRKLLGIVVLLLVAAVAVLLVTGHLPVPPGLPAPLVDLMTWRPELAEPEPLLSFGPGDMSPSARSSPNLAVPAQPCSGSHIRAPRVSVQLGL